MRLSYPSVDEARADTRASNDGTLPLEPYQLISQYTLEPLLKSVAETLPTVTVRFGCEFLSLRQDGDGRHRDVVQTGGEPARAFAPLIWSAATAAPARCAASSASRSPARAICWGCARRCSAATSCSTACRSANGPGHGRHYHVADDKSTFLIMQDSTKHWTLHSVVDSDEEMKAAFEQVVGVPVKYEMLSCAPWRQNLLLADRYGKDRVFLAGDAVHLVIPTGGLGMNSGVGDAVDLSWKLAATLAGWGGPESAQILRDRAPPDRRPQCRRLALRHHRPAQMAFDVAAGHHRGYAGRRARPAKISPPSPTSSSARATR